MKSQKIRPSLIKFGIDWRWRKTIFLFGASLVNWLNKSFALSTHQNEDFSKNENHFTRPVSGRNYEGNVFGPPLIKISELFTDERKENKKKQKKKFGYKRIN